MKLEKSTIILSILLILACLLLASCSNNLGAGKDLKLKAVKDKITKSKEYIERTCTKWKDEKTATSTIQVCEKWEDVEKVKYSYYDEEAPTETYKGYPEKKELRTENSQVFDKGNGEYIMRVQEGRYKKIGDKFYKEKEGIALKSDFNNQYEPLLGDTDTTSSNDKDSWIFSHYSTTNYGTQTFMRSQISGSGRNRFDRPIIGFTLPSLTGTISQVDMYLYNNSGDSNQKNLSAYEITQNAWTELGVNWDTYDGSNNWTSAGGDYNASAVDTVGPFSGMGAWRTWNLQGTGATNSLSLNFGDSFSLILILDEEGGSTAEYTDFRSRDYTDDTGLRPYLEITYTTGGTPPATPAPVRQSEFFFN